jgi:hypothetical protein
VNKMVDVQKTLMLNMKKNELVAFGKLDICIHRSNISSKLWIFLETSYIGYK